MLARAVCGMAQDRSLGNPWRVREQGDNLIERRVDEDRHRHSRAFMRTIDDAMGRRRISTPRRVFEELTDVDPDGAWSDVD